MFKYVLILLIALVFCTCKKYNEGGTLYNAKSHLLAHGGNWYVEKFEVSVDSADAVSNLNPNFENERNIKMYSNKSYPNSLFIKNISPYFDSYQFMFSNDNKFIDAVLTDPRCSCQSLNCYSFIFTPNVTITHLTYNSGYTNFYQINYRPTVRWQIIKLTKTDVILTSTISSKNYLIKLLAN